MNRRVTIKDIASAAEVSTGAVHLALNNKRGVSEETREKIRDLNLKPKTYEKFVFECAKIAFDNYDDTEGEAQTPATT